MHVSCGDPLNMKKTVKLAEESGVKIGAHPSYFDILGFGEEKLKLALINLRQILFTKLVLCQLLQKW
ncbi:MAG: hypothetical protein CM1200mP7_3550 [Chloroflexota bacterium]|nr:MAG: hypothetical protein CM1200mP7_3550 [Chloroflexota bacterium]